jgi:thiaminase/transcriptional activator TenA
MTLSQDLWMANQELVQETLRHPFVQGIADGTLPLERFRYYVGQDAFYLDAFARAYSVAAARAPDGEGFRTLHMLVDGALQEAQLHESYAAEWGVDLHSVEPGVTTRRYTDFLLATAWGHETGLTVAAMGPCMRLYAYLGQELARGGIPQHAYTKWLRTYSDPAIQELVDTLDGLIDRYAPPAERAHAVYRYAMLCERDFFQAAWER